MKPLAYPDIPGNVISRAALDIPGAEGIFWFATLKMDGWRCVVHCTDGMVTYWSKKLFPLNVDPEITGTFERDCLAMLGQNWTLDCELTGNRRSGDAARIYILSLLHCAGVGGIVGSDLNMHAYDRWLSCHSVLPSYTVKGTCTNFAKFYDCNQDDPLAEGVVLMRKGMKYIGNTSSPAANPGIIKSKWRAGMSGTSWRENG
jgi:hypothetical protein